MNSWFDVDKDGFGQLMADRPKVALLSASWRVDLP